MSGGLSYFDGRRGRRADRRTARLGFLGHANIERNPTLAMVYRAANWALDAIAKDSNSMGARKEMQYKIVLAEVRQNQEAGDGPHTVGATGVQPA